MEASWRGWNGWRARFWRKPPSYGRWWCALKVWCGNGMWSL
jgi:hypothetical protein